MDCWWLLLAAYASVMQLLPGQLDIGSHLKRTSQIKPKQENTKQQQQLNNFH